MNVTRTLVATLLIGSIIAGFVQGLSTQSASGVVTSYSTITSAYYSTWYGTTTSTGLIATTVRTVTQTPDNPSNSWKQDGPYLKIDITFSAWYERGNNHIEYSVADGKITNLMNVRIEKASIILFLCTKDRKVTDEVSFDFYSIPAMGTESFSGKSVPVHKTFYLGDAYLDITKTVIVYEGGVVIETPVAYAFAVTRIYTSVTTGTIAYTISGPLDFLGQTGGILLFAVAAMAAILVVVAFRIRGKARAPAKKEEIPAKLATKACVKCGFQLPADAEYCLECGQKQT